MINNAYQARWANPEPYVISPLAGQFSNGWNYVELPFSEATYSDLGLIDWSAVNWVEFYTNVQNDDDTNYFIFDDLEEKGWIVDKWSNNVSDFPEGNINLPPEERGDRKLVKVRNMFLGPGKPMMLGAGFPDFIAFQFGHSHIYGRIEGRDEQKTFHVIGVEAKSDGHLNKEEKAKCKWLLENNIFSKILIAQKGEKRGEILYKEFE